MRYTVWYRRPHYDRWYSLWRGLDWPTACRRAINARDMGTKVIILPDGAEP